MARWAQVSVVVPRGSLDAAGQRLLALGATGLQEDFLPGEAPPPRQPWDTGPPAPLPPRALLRGWFSEDDWARVPAGPLWDGGAAPTVEWQDDQDWAESWKAGFSRLEITDDFAVAPPWEARPGDLVIEPGMAFGTGEHPTTRACLGGVLRNAVAGGRCLDVGTGTGVLALAAVRKGMTARGIDIDADAVTASIENAELNGLQAEFDATPLHKLSGRWELVVANVYAEVLVLLAPDLRRLTAGRLLLAGILADRAPSVVAALAPMRVVHEEREGDWVYLELVP